MKYSEKVNLIILHHNDMDGYVAAKIVANYFKSNDLLLTLPWFVECNYGDEEWLKTFDDLNMHNTVIFIVDFSVKPDIMRELLVKTKKNVVWIDHHITAIEEYRQKEEDLLYDIQGLRVTHGFCGAELCWLYLHQKAVHPYHNRDLFVVDGKDIHPDIKEERDFALHYIPQGVRLVGDWDTWRWGETNAIEPRWLNYHFNMKKPDLFKDEEYEMYFGNIDKLQEALHAGEVAYNYEMSKCKNLSMFPVKITGFEDVDAVACNYQGGSSLTFTEVNTQYEVGICYHYNGTCMVYGFYRLGKNPEKLIHCGTIAKKFGGGGHMGAAGALVDKNLVVITKDYSRRWKKSRKTFSVPNISSLLRLRRAKLGDTVVVRDASADPNIDLETSRMAMYVRIGLPEDYRILCKGWSLVAMVDPLEYEDI